LNLVIEAVAKGCMGGFAVEEFASFALKRQFDCAKFTWTIDGQ
jgi:hypothetical protein